MITSPPGTFYAGEKQGKVMKGRMKEETKRDVKEQTDADPNRNGEDRIRERKEPES